MFTLRAAWPSCGGRLYTLGKGRPIKGEQVEENVRAVDQSAGATITKEHGLGALTAEIYFLTVLESGSLRWRCWRSISYEAFLLGSQMATFSLCPHMSSLCLCLNFLFCRDTRHSALEPTLVTSFFNVITTCKTPLSKYSCILRFRELRLQPINFVGVTNQPIRNIHLNELYDKLIKACREKLLGWCLALINIP